MLTPPTLWPQSCPQGNRLAWLKTFPTVVCGCNRRLRNPDDFALLFAPNEPARSLQGGWRLGRDVGAESLAPRPSPMEHDARRDSAVPVTRSNTCLLPLWPGANNAS